MQQAHREHPIRVFQITQPPILVCFSFHFSLPVPPCLLYSPPPFLPLFPPFLPSESPLPVPLPLPHCHFLLPFHCRQYLVGYANIYAEHRDLFNNGLTGPIPASLSALSNLQSLLVSFLCLFSFLLFLLPGRRDMRIPSPSHKPTISTYLK